VADLSLDKKMLQDVNFGLKHEIFFKSLVLKMVYLQIIPLHRILVDEQDMQKGECYIHWLEKRLKI
jgi:hypothetical protein